MRAGLGISTVVAADHDEVVRRARESAIRAHPSLKLTGSASSSAHALTLITELRPQVAVLSANIAESDSHRILHGLQVLGSATRVLVLSSYSSSSGMSAAFVAGAAGYASASLQEDELHDAILAIASGEIVLPRRRHDADDHLELRRSALTRRELQTLMLISLGLGTKMVASRLEVSPHTIHTNLARIYEKLNVGTQAGAVGEAMRRGLL